MAKIIEEVRAISSEKIAQKQKNSENNYPNLIERIKREAGYGKTSCEFEEREIDEYSKRLLVADGFSVYASTKKFHKDNYLAQRSEPTSIWVVSW